MLGGGDQGGRHLWGQVEFIIFFFLGGGMILSHLGGLRHKSNVMWVLIICRDGVTDDQDFVFEEFVRLRVAGIEESNETEA